MTLYKLDGLMTISNVITVISYLPINRTRQISSVSALSTVFCLCVLVSPQMSLAANWQVIGSSEENEISIDIETVVRDGSVVTYWDRYKSFKIGDAWISAIEDTGRQDWYDPKPRQKEKSNCPFGIDLK